jgi:hypothetical protein
MCYSLLRGSEWGERDLGIAARGGDCAAAESLGMERVDRESCGCGGKYSGVGVDDERSRGERVAESCGCREGGSELDEGDVGVPD